MVRKISVIKWNRKVEDLFFCNVNGVRNELVVLAAVLVINPIVLC